MSRSCSADSVLRAGKLDTLSVRVMSSEIVSKNILG